ncbi:alpha/beta fold hydrolase [Ornithinimicrobium tianjinense]|uniref:Alpha/beta hydrolase n=1 Tax=Ornithinimicrobium tianjinense TaxID=1195761 RepID=A0A917BKS1_9MICO|nr:alpha/beta fold hydrolase [Ornithinimicrobium tianjinense]GGF47167.1 alpha/beta hydrolase [Ornithinimicrobium tianjinense]
MSTEGLHSTTVGSAGPFVVFLHGLFGRGRNFSTAAKALQPDARAVLVDLPNHGASPWTSHVDYRQMAGAVADLLRAGPAVDGPVHVVGHSMGGKTAMALALEHPELVDRLVVEDVSPGGTGEVSEFEHLLGSLARIDLASVQSLRDADAQLARDVPQPTLRGFLLQNLRRDDQGGFAWQANLELLRRELPTITGDIPQVAGTASFDGPVLWVAGGESDYVSEDQGPLMRRLFPQTRKVTVKGATHWVHSQRPEVFAEVLRRFLLDG